MYALRYNLTNTQQFTCAPILVIMRFMSKIELSIETVSFLTFRIRHESLITRIGARSLLSTVIGIEIVLFDTFDCIK